jgi:hypothetical protein
MTIKLFSKPLVKGLHAAVYNVEERTGPRFPMPRLDFMINKGVARGT